MRATRARGVGGILTVVVLAACGTSALSPFAVDDVWARATPNGLGALYATVTTDHDDMLVDVVVDREIAGIVELHEVINDDGVMRMQQVAGIPVSRGNKRVLRPGDYHVMLRALPRMLGAGETFTVTFIFASGRTLQSEAHVRTITDDTMSHDTMHEMDTHATPMSDEIRHGIPKG